MSAISQGHSTPAGAAHHQDGGVGSLGRLEHSDFADLSRVLQVYVDIGCNRGADVGELPPHIVQQLPAGMMGG